MDIMEISSISLGAAANPALFKGRQTRLQLDSRHGPALKILRLAARFITKPAILSVSPSYRADMAPSRAYGMNRKCSRSTRVESMGRTQAPALAVSGLAVAGAAAAGEHRSGEQNVSRT